jgi:hypothetical protein
MQAHSLGQLAHSFLPIVLRGTHDIYVKRVVAFFEMVIGLINGIKNSLAYKSLKQSGFIRSNPAIRDGIRI